MRTEKFYQSLGYLFYAIAASDKKIHPKEWVELKRIVRSEWMPLDDFKDSFGTDTALQIEIVFDWLQAEAHSAESSFSRFEKYFKDHQSNFDGPVKELILKTSSTIAQAFSGKNKAEWAMLSRLAHLLR